MAPDQNEQELRALFSQWLEGNGDTDTIQRLSELAEDNQLTGTWQSLLSGIGEDIDASAIQAEHASILDNVYRNLVAEQPGLKVLPPVRNMNAWIKYAAAAAVLLLTLAGAYYFFFSNQEKSNTEQLSNTTTETPSATENRNKAVLTLADGKQIILDSSGKGQLAQQEGAFVFKSAEGQLEYRKNDSVPLFQRVPEFNTVATPRGGEFIITLPDGTKVWLNAASSITFPTAFNGDDRTVTVQGEVYMEVARDAVKHFRVKVKNAIIDVLGTSFNVNAYNDEPAVRTTLLEGSISLSNGTERRILKPGQQVWFRDNSTALTLTSDIDTEQVMAWKNGSFDFRNQDIESVMNQLGRWYNMDIVYEGKKPEAKILGMMGRNMDLNTLLKSLELTSGIRFKVEPGASRSQPGKIIVKQ